MDRSLLFSIAVTMLVQIVLVIGAFFTQQADLRHLEARLAQDEAPATKPTCSRWR